MRPGSGAESGEREAVTYVDAVSLALREALAADPRVVLIGQDIAEHGGAFGVTRGLVHEFGRRRVINTPISESAALGMATGAALLGRRPVVEMQFGDFVSCAFNQVVNVAAKMRWRTGDPVPLVIRCPVGAGAGAGPFHSQSVEAWFTHAPGLKVVFPAFAGDAYALLGAAIRDPDPVLFLEHIQLYRRQSDPVVREGAADDALGRARLVRDGDAGVVITWGRAVHESVKAATVLEGEGVSVAVLDLRTLVPLDEEGVLEVVGRTGKVLVVHDAPRTGGYGAEIAARVAERAFEFLDGPVRRLAFPDQPVPFDRGLEAAALPNVETIAAELRELLRW